MNLSKFVCFLEQFLSLKYYFDENIVQRDMFEFVQFMYFYGGVYCWKKSRYLRVALK